ncbi:hypothetical protein KWE42_13025 [Acinetobacter pittii]|nr:hypothetical protein DLK06_13715 [Acinetobacter pittii]EHU1525802.1 hypothetical protein [Acinetobacter baumannii]EXE48764.1 hypothetical protein J576_2956 [Acinetobacter sp. 766875]DAG77989.1 MAG TPA: hypothetical protein [Caudoviricetes sp.]EHU1537967.1 hypothetical protein [Acinetobacter baumannii]
MKKNMKEIEKYVGYYLLVYICVLIVCGFFQYMMVCQGKSLQCNFSIDGINKIITTTATILTPIIAIIGFLSWRNQETYKKSQELIEMILDKVRDLQNSWHASRDYEDFSLFQQYCAKDIFGTKNFDDLELFQNIVKRNQKNIIIFNDLLFLSDKLYYEAELDFSELDKINENIRQTLENNMDDLLSFRQELVHLRYGGNHEVKSEIEMRQICDKLDSYCNYIMGRKENVDRRDYTKEINETIHKLGKELIKLKKQI